MTNTKYLMEVSILSTVLFAHHQFTNEDYFANIELQEEWFSIPFHKLVVKTINHSRATSKPIYEEFIAEELLENRIMDNQRWLNIINANPFSRHNFEVYLEQIKQPNTSLHQGI